MFEKAMGGTGSYDYHNSPNYGQGGAFVFPKLADQIIPLIRQKSYLRQFLQSFVMPTENYLFPKLTTGNSVYFVAENTVAPASQLGTGSVSLVAKKLMTQLVVSAELQEDAVVPIADVIRNDMAKAFALAEENVFINGDTAITGTAAVTGDPRMAFDGLIKAGTNCTEVSGHNIVDAGGNALTLADISNGIAALDVFGRDKSELLLIVSLKDEAQLRLILGIDLVLNQLGGLTGTALPGEIGKVYGIPVVATNLLGGYDPTQTQTTTALLINRNAAIIGDRRIFNIKSGSEVLMAADQLLITASERIAFGIQYCQAIVLIKNIGYTTP